MARYIDADKIITDALKEKRFVVQKEDLLKSEELVVRTVYKDLAEFIDSQPTADVVEVKHGEWVYDHWCEFKCSICGHWSQTEPRARENYCPKCGAKMDGGKAE